MRIRKAQERGHVNHGWLNTFHTFSFASYHDPKHMGFRALRVINEDTVGPGQGFGTHPHNNMEIMTYVMSGALEHKDSMGNGSIIRPGDVQVMSAGSGVTHSEFNPSGDEPTHLLQIWIQPNVVNGPPNYQQRRLPSGALENRWALLASGDPSDNVALIRQDARIHATKLSSGSTLPLKVNGPRAAWLHVAQGNAELSAGGVSTELNAGDAAALEEPMELLGAALTTRSTAEVLWFDLP